VITIDVTEFNWGINVPLGQMFRTLTVRLSVRSIPENCGFLMGRRRPIFILSFIFTV